MNVLRHGKIYQTIRAKCPYCCCYFEADHRDFNVETKGASRTYYCRCPECYEIVRIQAEEVEFQDVIV